MSYTNSSLVSYTNLTNNHSGLRTHEIDRITPHCVVGQCSAKTVCDYFASIYSASSNYVIGVNGEVGMSVEEKNRSWCSSNKENDQRAVTIECASDAYDPYAFKDVVYNKLIDLCVDICQRNGKNKLIWFGDKNKTLAYEPASNEMVLTVHRWFDNKACPGDWLYNRLDKLASAVTAKLGGETTPGIGYKSVTLRKGDTGDAVKKLQENLNTLGFNCGTPDGIFGTKTYTAVKSFQLAKGLDADGIVGEVTLAAIELALAQAANLQPTYNQIYRIRKTWSNAASQIGAYKSLDKAIEQAKKAGAEYCVFDQDGKQVYPEIVESYLVKVTANALNVRAGAGTNYKITGTVYKNEIYTIVETKNNWGKLKSGIGWISLTYAVKL